MANELITTKDSNSWLVTQYDPKYAKMLVEYAYKNLNIIGFYGEHYICPKAAAKWEEEHEEWRQAVMMADYRVQAGLNVAFSKLREIAGGIPPKFDNLGKQITRGLAPDYDMLLKIIFKISDTNLKIEKDTGSLKQQGLAKLNKTKQIVNAFTPSEMAQDILNEMLNKGNNSENTNTEDAN